MTAVVYATREDVMSALDTRETARSGRQIDRNLASSSRQVEGLLHRVFYPTIDTRTWDWPDRYGASSWSLWLDDQELASVSALVSGGVTLTTDQYLLRPDQGIDAGPPYDEIQINQGTSASFSAAGSTWQRSLSITGLWMGCPADTDPAGALNGTITDTATTLTVTDSSLVGVGSILKIESEYLIVTAKTMIDTTVNLGGSGMTAASSSDVVAVASGAAFAVDEIIMIDSERMLIMDIAGNNLVVDRAHDGSTLAAHSAAADIYARRSCTVTRGALGSTAASHGDATAIVTHRSPPLVKELTIAETIVGLAREQSGYARTIGNADMVRSASVRDLTDLRDRTYAAHGRKARVRAI